MKRKTFGYSILILLFISFLPALLYGPYITTVSAWSYPEDTYHIIYGTTYLEPTHKNLQYAIDNAGSEIIFLPIGTILVNSTLQLRSGNRIIGRGQEHTLLKRNFITYTEVLFANGNGKYGDNKPSNLELAYFSIEMENLGQNAISITNGSNNNHIHHLNLYTPGYNGIYTGRGNGGPNSQIENLSPR